MADGLLTEEREREAELRMLEELWSTPPPPETPAPADARDRRQWLADRLGRVLAFGWLAFVVSVFFEPVPPADQVTPLWADLLVATFFLTLLAAGIMAVLRVGKGAYAVATVAGLAGMALGAACGLTEHHPSGWWTYEVAATGALTALAVAGLVRRR